MTITRTFTASDSWTAPAGAKNVVLTAEGAGGAGAAGGVGTITQSGFEEAAGTYNFNIPAGATNIVLTAIGRSGNGGAGGTGPAGGGGGGAGGRGTTNFGGTLAGTTVTGVIDGAGNADWNSGTVSGSVGTNGGNAAGGVGGSGGTGGAAVGGTAIPGDNGQNGDTGGAGDGGDGGGNPTSGGALGTNGHNGTIYGEAGGGGGGDNGLFAGNGGVGFGPLLQWSWDAPAGGGGGGGGGKGVRSLGAGVFTGTVTITISGGNAVADTGSTTAEGFAGNDASGLTGGTGNNWVGDSGTGGANGTNGTVAVGGNGGNSGGGSAGGGGGGLSAPGVAGTAPGGGGGGGGPPSAAGAAGGPARVTIAYDGWVKTDCPCCPDVTPTNCDWYDDGFGSPRPFCIEVKNLNWFGCTYDDFKLQNFAGTHIFLTPNGVACPDCSDLTTGLSVGVGPVCSGCAANYKLGITFWCNHFDPDSPPNNIHVPQLILQSQGVDAGRCDFDIVFPVFYATSYNLTHPVSATFNINVPGVFVATVVVTEGTC